MDEKKHRKRKPKALLQENYTMPGSHPMSDVRTESDSHPDGDLCPNEDSHQGGDSRNWVSDEQVNDMEAGIQEHTNFEEKNVSLGTGYKIDHLCEINTQKHKLLNESEEHDSHNPKRNKVVTTTRNECGERRRDMDKKPIEDLTVSNPQVKTMNTIRLLESMLEDTV